MSNDNSKWVFFNSLNPAQKLEVNGLNSAKEFVNFLRHEELSSWHVKESNTGTTKAVKNCSELFSGTAHSKLAPLKLIASDEVTRPDIHSSFDKRNQKRVSASYLVTLTSEGNVFSSYSKNVSSGGLLLEDPVPEHFLMSICHVVINSGDNLVNLEFSGKVLSSSKSGTRIKFEGQAVEQSLKKLIDFLENVEKKKKSGLKLKVG